MKKVFRRFFLALSLLSLFGCGLKGPLYMPPEQKAASTGAEQNANQASHQNVPVQR
ncbi:putative lipoprotein|nr:MULTISPECIES: lipoprotein [Brenneria]MCV9879356.1 lipoprotein [Brenneria izbisi]NMN90168.1 putative lipoprotein [Brenneria salicis ATCC 15712 = DSM 30166]RBP63210.1 putative lipoprotein [Brenneria salicis ATCC 15712 = DSM 30166]